MTSKELKKSFDKYYSFPVEFWESIFEMGEVITVEKEIAIKNPYQIEDFLYYIIEGSGGILLWSNAGI